MPRKRVSVKDQARQELAVRLRLPVTDILDRDEAAAFLGLNHKTSLSNLKANGPGFYKAPIGRTGYTLYRRDWLKNYADGKVPVSGEQPWPPARQQAPYANSEDLLDNLVTGDKAYKDKVLTGW